LIPAKQEIVRDNTESEFNELGYAHARGCSNRALLGLREQLSELTELRGKNKGVVEYMMGKVRMRRKSSRAGLQRYYAVRSIFSHADQQALRAPRPVDTLRLPDPITRATMLAATFSKTLSTCDGAIF
jgi:hypothetical protein